MGLTGVLLEVSKKTCGHCRKKYGEHSKKNFMKCLYTANLNLYSSVMELNKLRSEMEVDTPKEAPKDDKGGEDGKH